MNVERKETLRPPDNMMNERFTRDTAILNVIEVDQGF